LTHGIWFGLLFKRWATAISLPVESLLTADKLSAPEGFLLAKTFAKARNDLFVVAALVGIIWVLHGHALSLGFWFDDHTHLELCRQNGFHHLAGGNRFDWNGHITHVWWAKKETGWAYFRPLTVALRVSLFQLFGLNAVPFHVVHLGLFTLSVMLLYGFLRHCGWRLGSSTLVAFFFIVHPANAFTIPWLANDGPVLVGLWLVSGLWLTRLSAQSDHRRLGFLLGIGLCYALALLTRENGIVVGPLLVLFDAITAMYQGRADYDAPGGSIWKRRWALYTCLGLEGIVYLPVRAWLVSAAPSPRAPYFHWPTEPGFAGWLPYKILNGFLCLPLGLPFIPIVEVPWWQRHWMLLVTGVFVLAALATILIVPLRRSWLMWSVLGALFLAQSPTILAFSAPYNYYLATAGWAVLIVVWGGRWWPSRPRMVAMAGSALAMWYLAGLWAGSWMLHSAATAEKIVRADIMTTQPGLYPSGCRLFFLNMPFFAAESAPALRVAVERSDLEIYPLTFAPELFFPRSRVVIVQESRHTFSIHCGSRSLFGGAFGEDVELGWYGGRLKDLNLGVNEPDPVAGAMPFRVQIIEMGPDGVRALRFIFEQPLSSPAYRFFLGSSEGLAREIHFEDEVPCRGCVVIAAAPDPLVCEQSPGRAPLATDFGRLRRMQMACDRLFKLLGPV
jgi:hypothetical protein